MTPSLLLLLPVAWAATGSISVVGEDETGLPVKGGQVLLDGFPTGEEIPGTLENVPTGEHRVSVKIGCGLGDAGVTVAAGKTAEVVVELEETDGVGTVRLKGMPEGARVRLDADEVDADKGSFEATCGTHKLRVSAPGFAPWEQDVVVTVEEWVAVDVNLVRGEMGDGGGVVPAGGTRGGGGLFEDDLEDDFEFDDGEDYDADDGDDAFLSAAPTRAVRSERSGGGTSSDSFLDDDDDEGGDDYVPPSVALALAGGDLSSDDEEDEGGGAAVGGVVAAAPAKADRGGKATRPPKERSPKPAKEPKPVKEKPPKEPKPVKEKPPKEPKPAKERAPKADRPPRERSGGPSVGQWAALGGSSAVALGGLSYALYQNGRVAAEQRAWEAAMGGGQSGEIIVAAHDRLESAKTKRSVGWITMGVGLAGAAGSTTWIMLSGDRDGAAFAVGGTF